MNCEDFYHEVFRTAHEDLPNGDGVILLSWNDEKYPERPMTLEIEKYVNDLYKKTHWYCSLVYCSMGHQSVMLFRFSSHKAEPKKI